MANTHPGGSIADMVLAKAIIGSLSLSAKGFSISAVVERGAIISSAPFDLAQSYPGTSLAGSDLLS